MVAFSLVMRFSMRLHLFSISSKDPLCDPQPTENDDEWYHSDEYSDKDFLYQ